MDLFFIIFPGVWGLVGVIFTAIGVGITSSRRRKEERCTMYTSGTVADVVRRRSYENDHAWYPVFSYYADGREIVRTSHFGNGKPQFTVGQTVSLYYDPENPESYFVAEESVAPLLGKIFTLVGIACLTVAVCIPIVVFILAK